MVICQSNKNCIVCHCPNVNSCKYVKGSVSCRWTQKECNKTGLCGVSCIEDRDCGRMATVRCMGGVGYDGICVPEISCRGSTQALTSNKRVGGDICKVLYAVLYCFSYLFYQISSFFPTVNLIAMLAQYSNADCRYG